MPKYPAYYVRPDGLHESILRINGKRKAFRGGEVEFVWKDRDKLFGIFSGVKKTPDSPVQILITRTYVDDPEPTEMWCDTADEVLEYIYRWRSAA